MSPDPEIYSGAVETEEEGALRQWWAGERLKSVDNLEGAARQIITLCTSLLGLLLGLLALSEDPLPAYLATPLVRVFAGIGMVGLLTALIAALVVVRPRIYRTTASQPDTEAAQFEALLAAKSQALTISLLAFGAGTVSLTLVLLLALLLAR